MKIKIGKCQCGDSNCNKLVTKENVITFDWAHNPGDDGECIELFRISELGSNILCLKKHFL